MRKPLLPCIIAAALLATHTICMATRKTGQPSIASNNKSPSLAPALPTPIYRCGNNYQASPCELGKPSTPQALIFHDRQTDDQIKSAKLSQTQLNKQALTIDKKQAKETLALQKHPPQAIGLDCRPLGIRPFERCKTTRTVEKSAKASQAARKEHDAQTKKGTFIARAPRQP